MRRPARAGWAFALLGFLVPGAQSPTPPARDRLAIVDAVWQTVHETFFDRTFGGVDWPGLRAGYRARAEAAPTEAAFYAVLDEMLGRLDVSHLYVITPGEVTPRRDALTGGIGIDVRMLGGVADRALITKVERESAAARAGVRAGAWLTSVDGVLVRDLAARGLTHARSPVERRAGAARAIREATYGAISLPVKLGLIPADQPTTLTILRTARPGRVMPIGGAPLRVHTEARQIAGKIVYLRIDRFADDAVGALRDAVHEVPDAPGIILDLRGNPGGDESAVRAVAGLFLSKPTVLMTLQTRTGRDEIRVTPDARPYTGPLAILTDELTASASEDLAAGFQELGRAVVVGTRTMGADLHARTNTLPSGGQLVHPVARPLTPKGVVIEGRGVIPNLVAPMTREALLIGRDPQIDAALVHFRVR